MCSYRRAKYNECSQDQTFNCGMHFVHVVVVFFLYYIEISLMTDAYRLDIHVRVIAISNNNARTTQPTCTLNHRCKILRGHLRIRKHNTEYNLSDEGNTQILRDN